MSVQHNNQNTLENIAADLTALANDLARGKLRVGNRLVAIGNPEFIKTKQKITGDTAYYTLSFQVPLLNSDEDTKLTDEPQYTPRKSFGDKHDTGLRLQGRPPEGKKIKKEITSLWKTVFRKLEQGETPTPAEEKSLVSAFESYTVFTESTWQKDWLACFTVLREALSYARMGDTPKALEYAAKVNALTKACHKSYK